MSEKKEKKIIVYSTPVCPYCTSVKDYLKEKKINFTEIDVATNQEAAKKIVEETKQMGVPVINIDGEYVTGFDQAKIDQLLEN